MPAKPDDHHKQGVRILMKLGKECGGDVREIKNLLNSLSGNYERKTAELIRK